MSTRNSQPPSKPKDGLLSVNDAAIAFVNTLVGGGIISIPYCIKTFGPELGILCHILMMSLLMGSTVLYLKTKDIVGSEGFGEIAFIFFGRSSIILINLFITLCVTGVVILYTILFSRIS